MISFKPFFDTLNKNNVSQYQLLKDKVIDNKILDSIKKNKNLTLLTLEKVCRYLNCSISDIVEFIDD